MFQFLLAPENLPFTVALGLMLVIGLLEGVTAVLGMGISNLLDSLLPDSLAGVDLTAGGQELDLGEASSFGPFAKTLGWMHIGRVPLLMLLVIFLFGFGLLGLIVQSLAVGLLGRMLPALLATVPAFVGAVFVVHFAGGLLARVMPKDETESVSERTFIGRVAHITLGVARQGQPAQAKLRDQFGRTHYVLVEPDEQGASFEAGSDVLLVRRSGAVFYGIRNTSDALVD